MSKVAFIVSQKNNPKKSIYKLAKKAGLKIKGSCKKGGCGKCIIKVEGIVNPPSERELKLLGKDRIKDGYRLACLTHAEGNVKVVCAK